MLKVVPLPNQKYLVAAGENQKPAPKMQASSKVAQKRRPYGQMIFGVEEFLSAISGAGNCF